MAHYSVLLETDCYGVIVHTVRNRADSPIRPLLCRLLNLYYNDFKCSPDVVSLTRPFERPGFVAFHEAGGGRVTFFQASVK